MSQRIINFHRRWNWQYCWLFFNRERSREPSLQSAQPNALPTLPLGQNLSWRRLSCVLLAFVMQTLCWNSTIEVSSYMLTVKFCSTTSTKQVSYWDICLRRFTRVCCFQIPCLRTVRNLLLWPVSWAPMNPFTTVCARRDWCGQPSCQCLLPSWWGGLVMQNKGEGACSTHQPLKQVVGGVGTPQLVSKEQPRKNGATVSTTECN